MASVTEVKFVDDIDGSEAAGTFVFGCDGIAYAIDLSTDNSDKIEDFLAPYIAAARKLGKIQTGNVHPIRPAAGSPVRGDREQNQAIREWANQHGFTVSERGRIPANVLKAYHQQAS